MPAFIKTPAEERRWEKAKKAAKKSGKKAKDYWALTNHIYQKMKEANSETDADADAACTEYMRPAALQMAAFLEVASRRIMQVLAQSPDYNFFVFSTRHNQIVSGWEYQADAKEDLRDNYDQKVSSDLGLKVMTRTYLKSIGIDPDDEANWFKGPVGSEPGLPDERAIDEMLYRQKWEGETATSAAQPITPYNKQALELDVQPMCGLCGNQNWTYKLREGLWACQRHRTSSDGEWYLDEVKKTEEIQLPDARPFYGQPAKCAKCGIKDRMSYVGKYDDYGPAKNAWECDHCHNKHDSVRLNLPVKKQTPEVADVTTAACPKCKKNDSYRFGKGIMKCRKCGNSYPDWQGSETDPVSEDEPGWEGDWQGVDDRHEQPEYGSPPNRWGNQSRKKR